MNESSDNHARNRPTRSFWSMLALAGVVAGIWFLAGRFDEGPGRQVLPAELADEPDLYMEEAIITQFRKDGALKYRLAAREIRHFEPEKVTRLLAPELTLYSLENPPWHLASVRGNIRQNSTRSGDAEEVVQLRELVTVRQEFADGRYMNLHGASLDLYPDRQYAETDQDVMIDTQVGRTRAVGLEAYLERGLIKLSSTAQQRVHTIVLPGQFK
ncbi:MAG: LPS export ABC transporter periplasmic protein LptC [Gammaproteobacteria bacterium]|nr:LPS export ABC transporter periplasmic protein LptC [Gammaproteobacteria bacterium]MCZ6853326.1 LPS export ABC transporter periplasmic protein LptC [Gammaproteobacteria bacterium]